MLWSCISAFPKDSGGKKKKKKIYNDSPRPPHPPDPIARSSRSPSSWGRNSGWRGCPKPEISGLEHDIPETSVLFVARSGGGQKMRKAYFIYKLVFWVRGITSGWTLGFFCFAAGERPGRHLRVPRGVEAGAGLGRSAPRFPDAHCNGHANDRLQTLWLAPPSTHRPSKLELQLP